MRWIVKWEKVGEGHMHHEDWSRQAAQRHIEQLAGDDRMRDIVLVEVTESCLIVMGKNGGEKMLGQGWEGVD